MTVVVAVEMRTAVSATLNRLLDLRIRLLRARQIPALQILAQRLEIGGQRRFRRLCAGTGRSGRGLRR